MDYSVHLLLVWGLLLSPVACFHDKGRGMAKSDVTSSTADASDVTWAHAVNTRGELERELNGTVDFIEADVSLGLVRGNEFGAYVPIMAHPPDVVSDILFEDWLDVVIYRNTGKGIKLDFKSLDAVEPSLIQLQKRSRVLNFPLWLNADILHGPIHAPRMPVKDDMFMYLCHQFFPEAVLSIGWTTEWFATFPPELWHYGWQHVRKMADIIRCFGYEPKYPIFTFPVRGIYASRSIKELQWLLEVVPSGTLTIWTATHDPLEVKDLVRIRKSFPKSRVYYDLPEPLREAFAKVKNNASYEVVPRGPEHWMTLTRGMGLDCSSYTYANNDTVMFGKSLHTAVLSKKLLVLEDHRKIRVQGKIEFFNNYDPLHNPSTTNNKLSLVIVDVSLFSKNLTSGGGLDMAGSDSDVLWAAVNSSHVYTFEEKPSHMCRMFRLDTSDDLSFQAWTVHCDDMREYKSFEEITAKGVQEVPLTRRLVLPKVPAMIGFVSSGEGYAVLHDFKIEDKEDTRATSASSIVEISLAVLSLVFLSVFIRRFYT